MIGLHVPSTQIISQTKGSIHYSGIHWNARLVSKEQCDSIPIDTLCCIVAVSGNTMMIEPLPPIKQKTS
jgi:membrane protein implicated in regulation of membrane protease activity